MKISPDRLKIIFVFGKMRQSDNGIHRRSYVVAHSRKKFRFRLCSLLCFFGSYIKLFVFSVSSLYSSVLHCSSTVISHQI